MLSESISLDVGQARVAHAAASCGNIQPAGILETLYRMREEYYTAQQRAQAEEIAIPDLEKCELEFARTNAIKREWGRKVEEASEALDAACVNHEVASVDLSIARERMHDLSSLKEQVLQLRDQYNMQWARLDLDRL